MRPAFERPAAVLCCRAQRLHQGVLSHFTSPNIRLVFRTSSSRVFQGATAFAVAVVLVTSCGSSSERSTSNTIADTDSMVGETSTTLSGQEEPAHGDEKTPAAGAHGLPGSASSGREGDAHGAARAGEPDAGGPGAASSTGSPSTTAFGTTSVLEATLTGSSEVPGLGDPDGNGSAILMLDPDEGEICYSIEVSGIAPASLAHVHSGPVGVRGDPIVTLEAPAEEGVEDCATVDRGLVGQIDEDPAAFYVDVHNGPHPDGALRGQLERSGE